MKTLKFTADLSQEILDGKKTATWRLYDDKNLSAGDQLILINRDTGKPFGKAIITSLHLWTLGTLQEDDWAGHERFSTDEEMYATYREFYGE